MKEAAYTIGNMLALGDVEITDFAIFKTRVLDVII
jgi:hypothetical protein